MLGSIVKFNNNNFNEHMQNERFTNEFNITHKNEQYKRVRNCFGARFTEAEKEKNNEQEKAENTGANVKGDLFSQTMNWIKMNNVNVTEPQENKLIKLVLKFKLTIQLQRKELKQELKLKLTSKKNQVNEEIDPEILK